MFYYSTDWLLHHLQIRQITIFYPLYSRLLLLHCTPTVYGLYRKSNIALRRWGEFCSLRYLNQNYFSNFFTPVRYLIEYFYLMFSFAENFEKPRSCGRTNVREHRFYNRFFRLIYSLIVYTIIQLCNKFIQEKTPDFMFGCLIV